DREAAPGFGVEVLIVDVEGRGVALALPLVATPEREEAADPRDELLARVLRELARHGKQDLAGRALLADGVVLDGVEQVVRHQVLFVRLVVTRGTELGSRLKPVDGGQRGYGTKTLRTGRLEPPQPLAQEGLVDPGYWTESAGRVA